MQGTGPGVTSTSAADGSSHSDGAHSTSDASSDTTSGSSTSELTEGSEGSTGGEPACVLPQDGSSWCDNQRSVAQILGCKTSADPAACYQTIVAQYEEGDWEILAAGDCDTAIDGPACAAAYSACTLAPGSKGCTLDLGDTLTDCAEAAPLDPAIAGEWCARIFAVWVVGCTTQLPGVECDLACSLPCAFGMDCLGPSGLEVCI